MRSVRVVLLDDHEIVRAGVRVALQGDAGVEVVAEASSARVALELISRHRPDVLIVDTDIRDGSGLALCRQLCRRGTSPRVLVLTALEDKDAVLNALEAGAGGYLLKRVSSSALAGAVHTVADGRSVIDPTLTRRVLDWVGQPVTERPRALAELTEQQAVILGLVAEGLSNKDIGERLHLAEKTVKNHITRIMATLGVRSRTQAARLAWQVNDETPAGSVQPVRESSRD